MGYILQRLYDYQRVGDPIAVRPITVEEMIAHLKLDEDLATDPEFILEMNGYIDAAIHTAEDITKRTMQESRFKAFLNCYYTGRTAYEVRKSPLQEMESITYLIGGVETTIPLADYIAALDEDFSRVQPIIGKDWPSTIDEILHSSTWTFLAGYKAGEIPADLLLAMKIHTAYLWSNRGDCVPVNSSGSANASSSCSLPGGAKTVYMLHRIEDIRTGV
jgi:uncharacterized phiE125 gp8 family phage protein